MAWHVYLLRCGDGTLYAGTTTDLVRRVDAHSSGKGARYTRGRGPLVVAWSEEVADRSAALRREHQIKRLPRAEKLRLARFRARR
jgi:predicted GIY-YIG superfamily endonuclease